MIGDAAAGGAGASADHLRTKKFSRQQTKAGGLSAQVVELGKEGSWLAGACLEALTVLDLLTQERWTDEGAVEADAVVYFLVAVLFTVQ